MATDNLIKLKNSPYPFYSQGPQIETDMDMFPYNRFYRGIPDSQVPVIIPRQAGWRMRHDACYSSPKVIEFKDSYPNHCFQAAPSTTYPCYPEYLRKYSDKREMEIQLFNRNVIEYR